MRPSYQALLSLTLSVCWTPLLSSAYPDRAGTCVGGQAAVAGFHTWTNKTVKSGPVSALFDVSLNGEPLSSNNAVSAETTKDYEFLVQIQAPARRRLRWMGNPLDSSQFFFQGILIRAEASDKVYDSAMLTSVDSSLQREETCHEDFVSGLCHVNPRAKTSVSAILRLDEPATVTLDLTITTRNSAEHSVFYYSNYTIVFDDARSVVKNDDMIVETTTSPSKVTIMAPSTVPSDAPSDVPSMTPTIATLTPSVTCIGAAHRLKQCLQTQLVNTGDDCDACAALVLQNVTATDCTAYEASACKALDHCTCGTCRDELQHFINCAMASTTGCSIQCEFDLMTPTVAPSDRSLVSDPTVINATVTPPTVSDYICATSTDSLAQCLTNELTAVDGELCDRWVAAALVDTTAGCDTMERAVCTALATCPCETCTDEVIVFLNCQVGPSTGCRFGECHELDSPTESPFISDTPLLESAPTMIPTPAATCKTEHTLLSQCFQTLTDSVSCDSCVANVIPRKAPACNDLQSIVCQAIDKCPCAGCTEEIERFVSCTFEDVIGCALSCV